MIEKKWVDTPFDTESARALAGALKVDEIYARLLVQRGITSFDEARRFFLPDPLHLHDPRLMKDMERAAARIDQARSRSEQVLVYGDYDVDGTTSVALMHGFLTDHGVSAGYYIPDRHLEGYGLSMKGIAHAADGGYTLLVALDCGISAFRQVARARELGIDVIICDHHLPDAGRFPDAYAVVNPKQAGCDYPFRELTGCGIGYKLISVLRETWGLEAAVLTPYLQLTALSTVADIVPMTGENRVLTQMGLEAMERDPIAGLGALLAVSREGKEKPGSLSTEDLAYLVAPRINAAGRMGEALDAVRLLMEKDEARALEMALRLHGSNLRRRQLDQDMTAEALQMIHSDDTPRHATVVYNPEWHKGVIGIVAARLLETCYRPTIVLTRSGNLVTGSARSVKGFNIAEALSECGDLLENYGGHYFAAGMTLKEQHLEAFRSRFEQLASRVANRELAPEISVDAQLSLTDIRPSLYNTLKRFRPFGPGNTEPVFVARGLIDTGASRLVASDHIRFEVTADGSGPVAGIGFKMADKFPLVASKKPFDACFHLSENNWRGRRSLQLRVLDIRASR
jgi:single-stranded-DNA-specific exonuclease